MKRLLLALLLTALTITIGCTEGPPQVTADITPVAAPTQVIEDINALEASALIEENQDNPDFVIIDVRAPSEFAQGHLENAINIDYYSETFRDELDQRDRNKTYLIYCAVGSRSASAVDIMQELNFLTVYHMRDGINQWQASGLPIVK